MLVEQADNICIKTVETSDLFDEFPVSRHNSIINKILDFVKYYE